MALQFVLFLQRKKGCQNDIEGCTNRHIYRKQQQKNLLGNNIR